jgi:hypothetical protein
MLRQIEIEEIVHDFVNEAHLDYVGLWEITGRVQGRFKPSDHSKVREAAMQIVSGLLSAGLEAVDLASSGPGCIRWENQARAYILDRISSEWDKLGRDPTIGDIVWFNHPQPSAAC